MRYTIYAVVTGGQTCALPICRRLYRMADRYVDLCRRWQGAQSSLSICISIRTRRRGTEGAGAGDKSSASDASDTALAKSAQDRRRVGAGRMGTRRGDLGASSIVTKKATTKTTTTQ